MYIIGTTPVGEEDYSNGTVFSDYDDAYHYRWNILVVTEGEEAFFFTIEEQ